MTPYKKIVDSLMGFASQSTEGRINRFNTNESFVIDEDQWTDEDKENEKIRSDQDTLTINQAGEFVMEFYLAKLFPRDPKTGMVSVGVRVKRQQRDVSAKIENIILNNYRENRFVQILLEQARNFFVGGNGAIYFPFDEGIRTTRIFSIDPRTVYVRFNGFELEEFMFVEGLLTRSEDGMWGKIKQSFLNNDIYTDKKITYWNKERFFELTDGKVTKEGKNETGKIPFAWLENMPRPHQHEGTPEIRDSLVTMQKQYNKILTAFGRRVLKNTKGKVAMMTDRSLEAIETESGEKTLYQMNPGDDIKSFEYKENKEVLDYASILDTHLKRSKGMNSATDGDIKTHVSGIAMQFAFAPLLDKIGLRRIPFDFAIQEINHAILENETEYKDVLVEPVYNPVVIQDYTELVSNVVKMRDLETPLISLNMALDVLHGTDVSGEEMKKIEKEVEENQKSKETELKLTASAKGVKGGTPPLEN